MIETEHGNFRIIKDYREALEILAFNERYVDYLDRYKYIVGDYSSDMLRLKGFTSKNYETIPDYLIESCIPNAPYFVLERIEEVASNSKSISKNKKRRNKTKKNT
jgi:uncharacterized protein YutD